MFVQRGVSGVLNRSSYNTERGPGEENSLVVASECGFTLKKIGDNSSTIMVAVCGFSVRFQKR